MKPSMAVARHGVALAFVLFAAEQVALTQPLPAARVGISDLAGHAAQAPAIRSMVDQGILPTIERDAFKPDAVTTRAQLAAAVQHMFGLKGVERKPTFTDVMPESPLYGTVEAVAPFLGRQTLCFGCALGSNFEPDEPVSQLESVVLLINVLRAQKKLTLLSEKQAAPVLAGFADAASLRGPLRVYVATAIRNGLMKPTLPNRMNIAPSHTRAQTAVLLDSVQRKFRLPKVPPID